MYERREGRTTLPRRKTTYLGQEPYSDQVTCILKMSSSLEKGQLVDMYAHDDHNPLDINRNW